MPQTIFSYLAELPNRKRRFEAAELVNSMDDPVTELFVVNTGLVQLVRFQENGEMVILQRAGPGAILAEASVFTDSYHCSSVAIEPSVLQVFQLAAVRNLLSNSPEVALAFSRHLATEVRSARKRAEILALRKVSDRLDSWLAWNDETMPDRGTWHHVAGEIGISNEALYRELAKRRKN